MMPGSAIWLASFPKSGNTWVRLMLRSLLSETGRIALSDLRFFGGVIALRDRFDAVLEIESSHLKATEILDRYPAFHDVLFTRGGPPQLVKVHDAWLKTSSGEPAFDVRHTFRAIYVIRDPRDVAVSWARFMGRSIAWALDSMIADPIPKEGWRDPMFPGLTQFRGHWSTHVTSWIDDSGLAPLVVRYEGMKYNPAGELDRIATHIGWPRDAQRIAAAVQSTRFERLAEQERRDGFSEKPASAERFFHTGDAGGWRDILTPAEAARIERDHGAVMARFGYC